VIRQVADMVGDAHKVDLTAPDKVILVEIYQVRPLLTRGVSAMARCFKVSLANISDGLWHERCW
jgi:tRNA(Ser,Leu) C12 N-acetylase TAN1